MHWPCIITAMVTPFTEHGELDEPRAESLAHWLVTHGSEGLVVAGTTGESPTLSESERERLYHATRRGAGSIPILVGTGSNDTRRTIELSRQAHGWGADGALVVTPYYNRPPQEGLYRHFVEVAEHVSLPLMLYNVPSRTGVNLAPDTASRITRACPQVVAIKEASGRIETLEALHQECPETLIYAGDDALFYPGLMLGAHGVVSVATHVVGVEMQMLVQAFRQRDLDRALEIHRQLLPIFRDLFVWPNPIPVKWLLNHVGRPVGPLRFPLMYPDETSSLEHLRDYLETLQTTDKSS